MKFLRTPPKYAVVEAVLGRVVIYDVAHLLPKHKVKKWRTRRGDIVRCYVHHSGRDGAEGFDGFRNSASYSTRKKRRRNGTMMEGWAGTPYTFWIPDLPDLDPEGRIIVYRGNPDEMRTYHTGGRANTHGVSWCFQGNRTKKGPSPEQVEAWKAFVPYATRRYGLRLEESWAPFCPHSASRKWGGSGKKACPGPFIERLVADTVSAL